MRSRLDDLHGHAQPLGGGEDARFFTLQVDGRERAHVLARRCRGGQGLVHRRSTWSSLTPRRAPTPSTRRRRASLPVVTTACPLRLGGDLLGEPVGAALVPREQADGVAAGVVHHDHRRIVVLAVHVRRDGPHHDPAGHDPDDRGVGRATGGRSAPRARPRTPGTPGGTAAPPTARRGPARRTARAGRAPAGRPPRPRRGRCRPGEAPGSRQPSSPARRRSVGRAGCLAARLPAGDTHA